MSLADRSSSHMDDNGQMQTEKFVRSHVGNPAKQMEESRQFYDNSASGLRKLGLEQMVGGRGRQMIKQQHRGQPETMLENFIGMDASQTSQFDQEWQALDPRAHLPSHALFQRAMANELTRPGSHSNQMLNQYPTAQMAVPHSRGSLPVGSQRPSYTHSHR